MRILLFAAFILYPGLGTKIFRTFQCETVGDKQFLAADMSVECYAEKHWTLIGLSCLFFALYIVGIPLFMVLKLRKHRVAILNEHTWTASSNHVKYESIYSMYRSQFYYGEIIEMFRKLLKGFELL